MANASIEIPRVIAEEGKFQNDAADSGNYFKGKLLGTKFGITPNAYFAFYKKEPSQDTIKNLTVAQAAPIYKKNYWDKIRASEIINTSVAALMMFMVVNSGIWQIKSIKQIMNATAGKNIVVVTSTPFTYTEISLLNKLPQQTLFNNLKVFRERYYRALVVKKPIAAKYLKGWLVRLRKHTFSGQITTGENSPENNNNMVIGVLFALGFAFLLK